MVITPRHIYLPTPRSASRTVTRSLLAWPHTIAPYETHHPTVKEVEAVRYHHKLPTITLLRDPLHILLSFWWKLGTTSFDEYIKHGYYGIFAPTMSALNGRKKSDAARRIYPYHAVTDKYFPYSKGVPAFLEYLGYTPETIHSFGVREKRPDKNIINGRHRDLVREYFPEDHKIWESQQ